MSIKKVLLTTATAAVFVPHNLSAEDSYFEYKLPSMVKSIAEGAETGSAGVAAREEVRKFSLDVANSGLNLLEDELVNKPHSNPVPNLPITAYL